MKFTLSESDTKVFDGHVLRRVIYDNGDIGGYIGELRNMSYESILSRDSIIYGQATVSGKSEIFGSTISGNASVYNSRIINSTIYVSNSSVLDWSSAKGTSQIIDSFIKRESEIGGNAVIMECCVVQSDILGNQILVGQRVHGHLSATQWKKAYMRCPEEGSFKKVYCEELGRFVIAKLLIPAGREKCRSSCAKTIAFYEIGGKHIDDPIVCQSARREGIASAYQVGRVTRADRFDGPSAISSSAGPNQP